MIAIFCGLLRAGGRPTVFGDGRQTRDYIYVGDVVAAALAAAESQATGPINSAPASRPTCSSSPRPSAGSAESRTSSPSSRRRAPARCSGSPSTPRRAERELGWRAETGLDEGLASLSTAV